MTLTIEALQIVLVTEKENFISTYFFSEGLNIIRADNTSGKTTCMDAVLYALGFEVLKGKKGREALKPVMYEEVEYGEERFKVLESFVELEISNYNGETITLRRQVKGEFDHRIVSVFNGQLISSEQVPQAKTIVPEYYYLHDSGAATREKGFHTFLKEFLSITLPQVSTTQGNKTPLYMECLFPLFFIEQRRGWTEIQATTPMFYKIQNVKKEALEYVLDLDVSKNTKLKLDVKLEKEKIRSEYLSLKSNLVFLCDQAGGSLKNFPVLSATLSEKPINIPFIAIHVSEATWLGIDEMIYAYRDEIGKCKNEIEQVSEAVYEYANNERKLEYELELERLTTNLYFEESFLQKLKLDLHNELASIRLLEDRITTIQAEVQRNQDVLKIKRFGADIDENIALGLCPTCNQNVDDTLFDQSLHQSPMSLEDNILLLKDQLEAARLILNTNISNYNNKQDLYDSKSKDLSNLRRNIRGIRTELTRSTKSPDVQRIRELVKLEEHLNLALKVKEQFEEKVGELSKIFHRWKEVLISESKLPQGSFSTGDLDKLGLLEEYFKQNLKTFGFKSKSIHKISLSHDNYKPSSDGFEIITDMQEKDRELSYQASASDNIRIIWAYTLALLELCDDFQTNHWGLVCFDEPGQHQMAEESLSMLFKKSQEMSSSFNQIIITTSQDEEKVLNAINPNDFNFINFRPSEKTIMPESVYWDS